MQLSVVVATAAVRRAHALSHHMCSLTLRGLCVGCTFEDFMLQFVPLTTRLRLPMQHGGLHRCCLLRPPLRRAAPARSPARHAPSRVPQAGHRGQTSGDHYRRASCAPHSRARRPAAAAALPLLLPAPAVAERRTPPASHANVPRRAHCAAGRALTLLPRRALLKCGLFLPLHFVPGASSLHWSELAMPGCQCVSGV